MKRRGANPTTTSKYLQRRTAYHHFLYPKKALIQNRKSRDKVIEQMGEGEYHFTPRTPKEAIEKEIKMIR